jgi:hypothetical protein
MGSETGPWWACARKFPPSSRKMEASGAPQKRAALLTTSSNTGWRFVGDVLMTLRISLVAICCSNAPLNARLRLSFSLSRSAYDRAAALAPLSGLAHFSQ